MICQSFLFIFLYFRLWYL